MSAVVPLDSYVPQRKQIQNLLNHPQAAVPKENELGGLHCMSISVLGVTGEETIQSMKWYNGHSLLFGDLR